MLAGDPIPPRRGRVMPGFSELAEMVDDFVKGEKVNLFTDIFDIPKRPDNPIRPVPPGGFTPRIGVVFGDTTPKPTMWVLPNRIRRNKNFMLTLLVSLWTVFFLGFLPAMSYWICK